MSDNNFIEKFQHKKDSELKYILDHKENYTVEALEATIHILKERQITIPDLDYIENEVKTEKEKKLLALKTTTEQTKSTIAQDNTDLPELYSKKVIMAFSGLFSTIFGAVLLMYNMKKTDNQTGRIQVLIFGILYTIITVVIVNTLNIVGNIGILFNIIGGAILSESFWNTFIGKEFQYKKRSWVKPAIISILITIPLVIAAIYEQYS